MKKIVNKVKFRCKTKQLRDAVALGFRLSLMSENSRRAMVPSMTPEQRGLNYQYGYISSLMEIAEFPDVQLPLDMTYATVRNLTFVIGYEFSIQRSTYHDKENINILEKSIASYLAWLAANEHGLKIEVTNKPYPSLEQMQSDPLWAGCNIKICSALVKEDFLDAIHGQITWKGNTLTIRMQKIINGYKRVTGHDLAADGIDDTQINFQ